MQAFDKACSIEEEGKKDILPFLLRNSLEGRLVTIDKSKLAMELQKIAGDAVLTAQDGRFYGVDWKVEESNKYGNLFLETWSNKKFRTPGWMFTLKTDILLYYFLSEKELLSISFPKLIEWAFCTPSKIVNHGVGRIFDFPEKTQRKYSQLNDTWGRCVPIEVIEKEVGLNRYDLG